MRLPPRALVSAWLLLLVASANAKGFASDDKSAGNLLAVHRDGEEREARTDSRENSAVPNHENELRNGDSTTSDHPRENEESVSYDACGDNGTCIPLCCTIGERLVLDKCVPDNGDYAFPSVYANASRSTGKTLDEVFRLVVRDPCRQNERFTLDPAEYPDDEYVFLENGSLYQPLRDHYVRSMFYCIAVVSRDQYDVTVCLTEDEEVGADSEYQPGIPVGLIVSLPFLLATFLVYSVLPELWTMHGHTLRGYIGSLFVAYLFLAVVQLTPPRTLSDITCVVLGIKSTAYQTYTHVRDTHHPLKRGGGRYTTRHSSMA